MTQLRMLHSERWEIFPKFFLFSIIDIMQCTHTLQWCGLQMCHSRVPRRGLEGSKRTPSHLWSRRSAKANPPQKRMKHWVKDIKKKNPPQPSCQFHCPPHQSGQTWVRLFCVYKKWHRLGFTSVDHWHCSWRRHTYPRKPPPRCWRHPMKRSPTCLLFSSLKHHPATGTDTWLYVVISSINIYSLWMKVQMKLWREIHLNPLWSYF